MSGLVLGAVVERVVIRPIEGAPPLNAIIVTLGLLVLLQAFAGMVWGGNPRSFPPAFSIKGFKVFGHTVLFSPFDLFTVLVVGALMAGLVVLFRRTGLGLQMRAAAFAPEVSRLLGVRVGPDVRRRVGAGVAGGVAGRRARRARGVRRADQLRRRAGLRLHRRGAGRAGEPAGRARRRRRCSGSR